MNEDEEIVRRLIEGNCISFPPIPVINPDKTLPLSGIQIKNDIDIAEESISFGTFENVHNDDYHMPESENPPQVTPFEYLRGNDDNLEAEIQPSKNRESQEQISEHQDEHISPIAKMAQQLMKHTLNQAKAQEEFHKTHLNLLEKQTEAIERLVEHGKRHQENYEKQLEIQVQLTKTMTQILSRLTK